MYFSFCSPWGGASYLEWVVQCRPITSGGGNTRLIDTHKQHTAYTGTPSQTHNARRVGKHPRAYADALTFTLHTCEIHKWHSSAIKVSTAQEQLAPRTSTTYQQVVGEKTHLNVMH